MERRSERGSLALFGVSMAVIFLTVGGLSIELWNVISQRRQLSAVADAAAAAGATAINEDAYRQDGSLLLIPQEAAKRALSTIESQPIAASQVTTEVRPTPELIVVEIRGQVDMVILRLVGADPINIGVTSQAAPFRGS